MRTILFSALLLYCLPVVAQPNVYKEFEVDSAAVPRDGRAYLTTFIQTNLRKPIQAEAQGLCGTIIVNGIVEPDGHISSVSVIRSLRPDCDREAARVFCLFNAWKPAQKDGKAVRQLVNIPVVFKKNEPFVYANGARVSYFDDSRKLTTDSSKAYYKQTMPLDSIGLPAGDIVVFERTGRRWKEVSRLPFIQKDNRDASGRAVQATGYLESVIEREGQLAVIDRTGRLVRRAYFQNGKRVGRELTYYLKALLTRRLTMLMNKWFIHAGTQMDRLKVSAPKRTQNH